MKILITMNVGYESMVLDGVSQALRSRSDWIVRLLYPGVDWMDLINDWRPDAAVIGAPEQPELLAGIRIPVVRISGSCDDLDHPSVLPDDDAVGRMAAEYLLDLNLKHFAFWGLGAGAFARRRLDGFMGALTKSGVATDNISICPVDSLLVPQRRETDLREWLLDLPKPAGLLASHDGRAYYINDIARDAGIDVPNEIALLGVDNDRLLCEITRPSLSSVALATGRIGHEVVRLLADLLDGRPAPSRPVLIPPVGVVSRGSTEMLAVDDPDMLRAILFIRAHATENVGVADVLRNIPISRSSLERKFRWFFNRTPGEEIRRLRLEKAQSLLAYTDHPMPEVARRSGFSGSEYMARVFVREMSMSPSAYRRMVTGSPR